MFVCTLYYRFRTLHIRGCLYSRFLPWVSGDMSVQQVFTMDIWGCVCTAGFYLGIWGYVCTAGLYLGYLGMCLYSRFVPCVSGDVFIQQVCTLHMRGCVCTAGLYLGHLGMCIVGAYLGYGGGGDTFVR